MPSLTAGNSAPAPLGNRDRDSDSEGTGSAWGPRGPAARWSRQLDACAAWQGGWGGKARCLTLREKRPSAACWTRCGETQSVFPSFAISSSQILVSSSISWFWKKSRP